MLSRIAEAKLAVEDEFNEISSKTTEDESKEMDAKAESKAKKIDGHEMIHLMSEYLFDLWDANCMEAYHRISEFEERAAREFDPEVEEFTFAQEALHKEFCQLFEELTEGFISENGFTLEQFYEEARVLVEEKEKNDLEGKTVRCSVCVFKIYHPLAAAGRTRSMARSSRSQRRGRRSRRCNLPGG